MAIEKMVVARKEATKQLSAACLHNAKDLGTAVERELRATLGRNAQIPAMEQLIMVLAESMVKYAQRMDEQNDRDGTRHRASMPLRRRRRGSLKKVGEVMSTIRGAVIGVYGPEVARQLELEAPLPATNAVKMQLLAEAFVEKGEEVLAGATPKPGLEMNTGTLVGLLRGPLRDLNEANEALRQAEAQARKSKDQKREAIQAFDENQQAVLKVLTGICRLAGQPHVADAFRPKVTRRRASKKAGAQVATPTNGAAANGTTPATPDNTPR